ncbi:hypothetical protein JOC78_000365 [Bacillus ectoiniformans]|uniref:hypothetical protein n=1 Tax=Bacillus ectoiniformans TaxID=1494429 RepID=UPI00195CE567|nr:hypothetical protein [Bacillus ectoiniformans]MBM7647444.1 hypothetical protein [Bacillus ectoiniformans]
MSKEQQNILTFIKFFSGIGCTLGILLFLMSVLLIDSYLLAVTGATILVISMWIFGIGLFFVLIEGLSIKRHRIE